LFDGLSPFSIFISIFQLTSDSLSLMTAEEDDRLIQQWLAFEPRWKFMEKQWEARNASQLKNRWYHVVKPRLYGPGTDFTALTWVLEQGRKLLPLPVLTKT
jgi:hypothetical protein